MAATTDTHRVVFVFDAESYQLLEEMTSELGFGSNAVTIREAMRILRAIQTQAEAGYSDVIVENPKTYESKKLMIEFVEKIKQDQAED